MTMGAAAYISPACHVGRHPRCDKGTLGIAGTGVPGVRREVCVCRCHEGGGAGRHQPAGSFVSAAKTVPSGAAA